MNIDPLGPKCAILSYPDLYMIALSTLDVFDEGNALRDLIKTIQVKFSFSSLSESVGFAAIRAWGI